VRRFGEHPDSRGTGGTRGLGPDRDRWDVARDAGERPGGGGRHEHDEVGRRPVRGLELERPVQRDDVRGERVGQERSRALCRGEQHPSGLVGERLEQPFLRRRPRDQVGAAERVGGRPADGRDALRRTAHTAPELARRVRAREDDPVVARDVDRVVAERFDRHERHVRDLVPERTEPLDERRLLTRRARDDDAGGAWWSHP
jgi:hypothetical protein